MKTHLLVVVGMLVSTAIVAQKSTRDLRKPEDSRYERMKRELALTDKQYASIKNIDLKYSKKRIEERANIERRRLEERETMRTLRLEREREMRKVFTPEQSKKWDEYRALQKSKLHVEEKGRSRHDGGTCKHFRKNRHHGRGSGNHRR